MISMFVKVDGHMQRYDTDETGARMADVYEYLRTEVVNLINPDAKDVGVVLLLIDNTK